jgi:outer membrane protein assembly factor BamB
MIIDAGRQRAGTCRIGFTVTRRFLRWAVPAVMCFVGAFPGCVERPSADVEAREVAEVRMVPPVGEGADSQWPQWRGPTRQSVVESEGYPDRWSDQQNVVWRTQVPGRGHSSPIVWEDRIFLTTAYDQFVDEPIGQILGQQGDRVFLDDRERVRSVLCFRRSDGQLLWETFVPHRAEPEEGWPKSSYASSTPVTDGQRVYAYFGNHGLLAVDFDGNVVWHDDLGSIRQVSRGTACSPLLYENLVILFQDHGGPEGSFIAAFDRETGQQAWRTQRTARVGWSSPIAIRVTSETGHRDEIITSSQHQVQAYDPLTGDLLWYSRGLTDEVVPSPVAGHGLVFASSGRQGPTLAIRPGGTGDVSDRRLVWRETRGSPFVPSPLLYQGHLYTLNDMIRVLSCYDAATGEMKYRVRLEGEAVGHGISSSPIGVDGKVFITVDDGQTLVVRAGPQFELLHVNRLGSYVFASPALLDGRWYFRTYEHLVCIGPETHRP